MSEERSLSTVVTEANADAIIDEINTAFYDIPFENSAFQTENFVIAASITPERAYRSIGLRLNSRLRALQEARFGAMREAIDIEELQAKIADPATNDFDRRRAEIDIQQKQSNHGFTQKLINDAIQECNILYHHFSLLPRYTRAEFEAGESNHFRLRLNRAVAGVQGAQESLVNMDTDMPALKSLEAETLLLLQSADAAAQAAAAAHAAAVVVQTAALAAQTAAAAAASAKTAALAAKTAVDVIAAQAAADAAAQAVVDADVALADAHVAFDLVPLDDAAAQTLAHTALTDAITAAAQALSDSNDAAQALLDTEAQAGVDAATAAAQAAAAAAAAAEAQHQLDVAAAEALVHTTLLAVDAARTAYEAAIYPQEVTALEVQQQQLIVTDQQNAIADLATASSEAAAAALAAYAIWQSTATEEDSAAYTLAQQQADDAAALLSDATQQLGYSTELLNTLITANNVALAYLQAKLDLVTAAELAHNNAVDALNTLLQ